MVTGQAASGAWCGMAGRSSRRQGKASSKQQRWRGGVIGSGDARGGQAKKQAATPGQGGGGAVGSGGSGAQQFFLFFLTGISPLVVDRAAMVPSITIKLNPLSPKPVVIGPGFWSRTTRRRIHSLMLCTVLASDGIL